jgi:hypothetical protein
VKAVDLCEIGETSRRGLLNVVAVTLYTSVSDQVDSLTSNEQNPHIILYKFSL